MESDPRNVALSGLALVAKGLAHPGRLALLHELAQGERSVESLAEATSLQVSTASAMLQRLHQAGLVTRRRDGQRVQYSLAGDDVARLISTLQSVAERHVAGVELARLQLLPSDVPVIDVAGDELLQRAERGELIVLDVRPEPEFAAAHIPGARSIPLGELPARVDELPAGTPVVAYCRGEYCVLSHDAARLLRRAGRSASALSHGMLEWRAEGRPVERVAA